MDTTLNIVFTLGQDLDWRLECRPKLNNSDNCKTIDKMDANIAANSVISSVKKSNLNSYI